MTVAVCFKCGEFKHGALTPCPVCGNFPVERTDIVTSVAMTDHYMSNAELEAAGKNVKAGIGIDVPQHLQQELAEALSDSGYDAAIRDAEPNIREEVTRRQERIQIEFFDLAEEAFAVGHSLVGYRDMITREVGSLWSTIRKMFRSVDYTPFVGIARDIQIKATQLEDDVDTFLSPMSDSERKFLALLQRHTKALREYSNFLVEQAEFMYKKSRSVSAPGTTWKDWKNLFATKEPILRECQSSGAELTLYYHEMNQNR